MLKKITSSLFIAAFLFTWNVSAQEEKKTAPEPLFDSSLQRTFFICESASHLDLNPHTSSYSNEAQIINGLQEGLFCYDPKTLDPLPALASSYRISRDKKRWTFTIREGAKLSNGNAITAQTVIDSWLSLQKTPYAPYASLLDCIAGIKEYRENNASIEKVGLKANGQKLLVTLNSPTAYLPRLLCHHAFAVYTGNAGVFSGAYKISFVNEKGLTLVKNENYWDKDNVALNEIQIIFSDNKKENTWLYNTGRTDWLASSIDSDALISKNDIHLCSLFGTTYLFFTCRNPLWNQADFRNALLAAVPWNELRKDNLIKATSLVYPLTGYPAVEGLTETSEDEAVEMMEEARRKAGIASDKKLEITFGITESDYMKELAQLLKDAWEKLGVELVPYKIKDEQYLSNIAYLNYDLFSYSWIGDYADPVAFLELFREGSTLNQTKWTNKDFTEKLNLSDSETDISERYKLLSQAEQILLDDGVIIPISHNLSVHAINLKAVGGWYTNALDIHPFKYLYFMKYEEEKLPNIVRK
jgi:oligopeptide transport system substrate-binding protein